jgi:DNA-binding CsgD family transcriptional regulator
MNLEAFQKTFSTYKEIDGEVVKNHVKKLSELNFYMPKLQSYILVQNTSTQKYEYVCDNFELLMGFPKEQILEKGMPFYFSKIHNEDVSPWLQIMQDLMTFTMKKVVREERVRCIYTWNYRVMTQKGNYENIQVHQTPLYFDKDGKPIIGFSQNVLMGNKKKQPIIGVCKKLNKQNEYETLFYKNYSANRLVNKLTNRELDIVKLMAKGNTTNQISEQLFISPHTTQTHKKNIMSKLAFTTTRELVNFCNENQLF